VETWESYLRTQLGENWQRIGHVGNLNDMLTITTTDELCLIDLEVTVLSDRWLHAIERRLAV
jgi:phosphoribosylformylglycinamidine synthase